MLPFYFGEIFHVNDVFYLHCLIIYTRYMLWILIFLYMNINISIYVVNININRHDTKFQNMFCWLDKVYQFFWTHVWPVLIIWKKKKWSFIWGWWILITILHTKGVPIFACDLCNELFKKKLYMLWILILIDMTQNFRICFVGLIKFTSSFEPMYDLYWSYEKRRNDHLFGVDGY